MNFPECAENCKIVKLLGAGECENICPSKFQEEVKMKNELLQVRIPAKLKRSLEEYKEISGRNYTDVVIAGTTKELLRLTKELNKVNDNLLKMKGVIAP